MAQVNGDAGTSSPLFPDSKAGVWGQTDTGYGVVGTSNSGNGVQGGSISGFGAVGTSDSSAGALGISNKDVGVYGRSSESVGVWGDGDYYGIYGQSSTTGILGRGPATGVAGVVSNVASGGTGVAGFGGSHNSNTGVYGNSGLGTGVHGYSISGDGIVAESPSGRALRVMGSAEFHGQLFGAIKFFKIDHPLDPANKYLYHGTVESSDLKNIYDGIAKLDSNGDAVVQLPNWFGALNQQYRYQLTCIGRNAPVYISQEIRKNRFKISGGVAKMKVCWQVTGVRSDKVALAKAKPVEEKKPAHERGYYLYPELYGKRKDQSILFAHKHKISKEQPTEPTILIRKKSIPKISEMMKRDRRRGLAGKV
jgi:hypothetical protein